MSRQLQFFTEKNDSLGGIYLAIFPPSNNREGVKVNGDPLQNNDPGGDN